jgi:hypothetical protein
MPERLWLYPRLPRPRAEHLAVRLRQTAPQDRAALAASSHPQAAPAPTGGSPVPEDLLSTLADSVRGAFQEEMRQPISNHNKAELDARLGRFLHGGMAIIPSDAAHEGVWSFMSLVLLPDVAAWRFPDCHSARLLGTYRNVFRRTWWRQHILGPVMDESIERPLGEDELVGIFERSRMARSHELARAMARYIVQADVADRSHFARELAKRVRRVLAYINVDALATVQIESLIEKTGAEVQRARIERAS